MRVVFSVVLRSAEGVSAKRGLPVAPPSHMRASVHGTINKLESTESAISAKRGKSMSAYLKPWKVVDTGMGVMVTAANGDEVADVFDEESAKLLAAAPEMLEALKAWNDFMSTCDLSGAPADVQCKIAAIRWQSQTAIKKAEGPL